MIVNIEHQSLAAVMHSNARTTPHSVNTTMSILKSTTLDIIFKATDNNLVIYF